jgi:hypothetical protein
MDSGVGPDALKKEDCHIPAENLTSIHRSSTLRPSIHID